MAFVHIVYPSSIFLDYFGTSIEIEYSEHPKKECYKIKPNSYNLNQFYEKYKEYNYNVLLQGFLKQKEDLILNDWMLYKLIDKTVDIIYLKESDITKDAIAWFYLFELGYDIRVLFDENELYLYAAIDSFEKEELDICAETMISGKRKYSLLNKISIPTQYDNIASKLNTGGKFFSIFTETLPLLNPQPTEKKVVFYTEKERYEIDFLLDKTLIDIWVGAPSACLGESFDVPLSNIASQSLIPQLEKLINNNSELNKINILLNFVASSSVHLDDREIYQREKYMTPEESLYNKYSDCDDRSSIFFYLIKRLIKIPVIVIAYPKIEHVNIGVALKDKLLEKIDPFKYKEINYFVCEPSSNGTTSVGEYQDDLLNEYIIVKEYLICPLDTVK